MIVSNPTPGSSGTLQGVDLLARSPKMEQQDGGTSSFSDLLGASDRADAPVVAARELRPAPRAAAPGVGDKSAAAPALGGDQSQPAPSALSLEAPAAPATPVGLDDAPPLLRDPRLDDPAELALEAAAIAMVAALVPPPQQLAAQPVAAEDSQTDLFADQGGGRPQAEADSKADAAAVGGLAKAVVLNSLVVPVSAVPAEVAAQLTGQTSRVKVKVQAFQAGTDAVLPALGTQVGSQKATAGEGTATQSKGGAASALPPFPNPIESAASAFTSVTDLVSPKMAAVRIGAEVVLTATPSQAVALAGAGQVLLSPDLSGATAAAQIVPTVFADKGSASAAEGQPVEPVSLPPRLDRLLAATVDAAPSGELIQAVLGEGALVSDSLPENPAKAFFAGQAQLPKPQSSPIAEPDSEALEPASTELPTVAVQAALSREADQDGSAHADEKAQEGDTPFSQLKEAPASPKGLALQKSQPVFSRPGSSLKPESEVGTLGAEAGGVQSEKLPVLEYPRESATQAKAKVDAGFSASSPALEASLTAPTQGAVAARPAQVVLSRPTVLPPVSAKTGELFNVVQNALERARSENPSHLAVEVTLEDGSSFGLEVRMSASGLQASFRSESQPLLKALENSWAGFLARESSETKVASAAFEGRSGFGQFSDNGASTGERRQQFEDSAAAALLGNASGMKAAPGSAKGEIPGTAANQSANSSGGMALYA
jgi:hypothetical protein